MYHSFCLQDSLAPSVNGYIVIIEDDIFEEDDQNENKANQLQYRDKYLIQDKTKDLKLHRLYLSISSKWNRKHVKWIENSLKANIVRGLL